MQTHDYNFVLVDGMGYRFERDQGKHEALVAFHADVHEAYKEVMSIWIPFSMLSARTRNLLRYSRDRYRCGDVGCQHRIRDAVPGTPWGALQKQASTLY